MTGPNFSKEACSPQDCATSYTKIPNYLLDQIASLRDVELRVILAIARSTLGWQRSERSLSIAELQKYTGLSKPGVIKGVEQGIERGVITRRPVQQAGKKYAYALVRKGDKVNHIDNEKVIDVDQQDVTRQHIIPSLVNTPDNGTTDLEHHGAVNDVSERKERRQEEKKEDSFVDSTQVTIPVDNAIPPPPAEEWLLPAAPLVLWRGVMQGHLALDEVHILAALAAEHNSSTNGYGWYWVGRAILVARISYPDLAINPRRINMLRAILMRWRRERAYGSDTEEYMRFQDANTSRRTNPAAVQQNTRQSKQIPSGQQSRRGSRRPSIDAQDDGCGPLDLSSLDEDPCLETSTEQA